MFTPVRILSNNGPMRVELARWRNQLVVVKRLQGSSPFLQARLKREADVVKKLEHDTIVKLLGSEGETLIYDYCPGLNLEAGLENGQLPLERITKITFDILEALAYAHENGVIHHDVKPANIVIKGDRALLTDFGFAKDLGMTAITEQNMMLGTPNYMAPEQFHGDRNDPRSDLFSVGAVLYHMLTGAPPHGSQMIRWLAGDERLKLEPVPEEFMSLQAVVDKALQRDPEARYQTAEEMRDGLIVQLIEAQ